MEKRFENQVAIVTGGAAGIGKAIVQRLAREGAKVTLFDVDTERSGKTIDELASEDLAVGAEPIDITDESQVREGIGNVSERYESRLDVLVHCAGIVGPTSTDLTEVDVKDFDQVYAVNVRGTFLMTKHALKAMKPRGYGRILHFASIAGKEGNVGMHAYSATKSAVIGLVKSVGKEYAESGITINAIAPAVIRTPMVDAIDEAQVKYMTDKIPMKRCGTLEEAAALSCWIVSPEASFNTGFTFDLTGGRAVY
ncbi:MAG: SDR family NAD(P)-dependent oxidoreductase [Verrucomicrobiota bacterium]